MMIILKNIPANTGNQKIEDFIRPAVNGGLLNKSARIENISILEKNTHADKIEYHGVVRITPDSAVKRIIKRLNGQRISGRRVSVTEYQTRSWHNDPRISLGQLNGSSDKRQCERRQQYVEVQLKIEKDISELFSPIW
ncbi:MAG: hypothetical protein QX198_02345 [Methylococcaceae bacterium]